MFTLEQIKTAHSKVKSGADFPNYIQELIKLGLSHYENFVLDGHSTFFGKNNYTISSPAKYKALSISGKSNPEQFKSDLKAHQQGQTDYMTFCNDSAKSGVEKWTVDLSKMTCTYYDAEGNTVLEELIPAK
jgi:uncharacterized protein YbcV (DUF1398 family)